MSFMGLAPRQNVLAQHNHARSPAIMPVTAKPVLPTLSIVLTAVALTQPEHALQVAEPTEAGVRGGASRCTRVTR